MEALLSVQDIDLKIRDLVDEARELQARCMREDARLNELKAEQTELLRSQTATRAQRDMYQNTLEDIRTAIKQLIANRTRAFKPRNRSSTEALRTEEDKLAVLLVETDDQLATLQKNLTKVDEQIAKRSEEVQKSQQAPEAQLKKLKNQIDDLEAKRRKAVVGIPSSLLRKYDRLRQSRSGVGLTVLHDGICRVCRMELPTGIRARLVQEDIIDFCPACGRMVAKIENSVDHKKLALQARLEQEKRMKEEEERARREEEEEARRAKERAVRRAEEDRVAELKKIEARKQAAKDAAARKSEPPKKSELKKAPVKAAPKKPEPKKAPAKAAPKKPEPKKAPVKAAPKKPEPKKAPVKAAPKKPEPKKPPVKAAPKKPEPKKAPAKVAPKKPEPKKAPVKAAPKKPEPKKAPAKVAPKKPAPKKPPVKAAPKKPEPKKAPAKVAPKKPAPKKPAPKKARR
mgnify:CR=1 FL=1